MTSLSNCIVVGTGAGEQLVSGNNLLLIGAGAGRDLVHAPDNLVVVTEGGREVHRKVISAPAAMAEARDLHHLLGLPAAVGDLAELIGCSRDLLATATAQALADLPAISKEQ